MAAGTRRTWGRPLISLCALALVVSGCGAIDRLGSATATDVVSRTLQVTGTPALTVETFNGKVSVLAGSGNRVLVSVVRRGSGHDDASARADLARVDVSIETSGSNVTVRARRSDDPDRAGSSGADVTVTLPASASADLRSSNGPVTSTGVAGPVRAVTSNALISVSGATAGVDAQTSNAPVTAVGATGGVTARSSGGDVDVRGASGLVDVTTSNARVRIEATDATVHAHTSSGSMSFQGGLAAAASTFETSNGDIEVTLPAGAVFALEARTTGADVDSEFEVEPGAEASHGVLVGNVGAASPATSISASTSNAAIRIRRSR